VARPPLTRTVVQKRVVSVVCLGWQRRRETKGSWCAMRDAGSCARAVGHSSVAPGKMRATEGWASRAGCASISSAQPGAAGDDPRGKQPRFKSNRPRGSRLSAKDVRRQGDIMTVKRMDNVGIVVEDIDAAIEFFTQGMRRSNPRPERLARATGRGQSSLHRRGDPPHRVVDVRGHPATPRPRGSPGGRKRQP